MTVQSGPSAQSNIDPKLVDRIRALLAKTKPDSGCTPAEMEAALAKALELMDKYQVDQFALDNNGERECETADFSRPVYKRVDLHRYLTIPVARFTNCRNWVEDGKSRFFGLPSDLVFAEWLLEALVDFTKRNHDINAAELMLNGDRATAAWSHDFLIGCVTTIGQTLMKLTKDRQREPAVGGGFNSLVIVRRSLVEDQMRARFPDLWRASVGTAGRAYQPRTNGFRAGAAAGSNATFNRPMSESGRPKLLGR